MVIPGFSDIDFIDRVVDFIDAINLATISPEERELLFC